MTKAFFWPKKKFVRGWIYIAFRLLRARSSNYGLSAGFACGVFACFTPLFGFHMILAVGLAWCLRSSIITALLGTFVGTPITLPLMWAASYAAGIWVLDIPPPLDDITVLSFQMLMDFPGQVLLALLAMMVGAFFAGTPVALVFFGVGYIFAGNIRRSIIALKERRMRGMKIRKYP